MSAAEWIAAMKKWKVPVKYYPGWDTRGRPGDFSNVNGIIIHHTGSDSQSDNYLKFLFVTGRPSDGIPGPLCHVSTDMDGDLWVGARGRANHAGRGSSRTLNEVVTETYKGYQSPELRPGPDNTDGNAHFYGNEVRFDGGQKMTAAQWNAAVLWAAAVCDHHGWTARSVIGHREWTTRKPDPGSTKMYEFRAAVNARLLAGPTIPPAGQEDDMPFTEADIRRFIREEIEKAKIDEAVWANQIADVNTAESGDTSAAATLLTWTAKRVLDNLGPKLDEVKETVDALAATLGRPNQ